MYVNVERGTEKFKKKKRNHKILINIKWNMKWYRNGKMAKIFTKHITEYSIASDFFLLICM